MATNMFGIEQDPNALAISVLSDRLNVALGKRRMPERHGDAGPPELTYADAVQHLLASASNIDSWSYFVTVVRDASIKEARRRLLYDGMPVHELSDELTMHIVLVQDWVVGLRMLGHECSFDSGIFGDYELHDELHDEWQRLSRFYADDETVELGDMQHITLVMIVHHYAEQYLSAEYWRLPQHAPRAGEAQQGESS